MIIRSAVLEGHVAEFDRVWFDTQMRTTVRDAIARYPGIRAVHLRWPVETEAGAPPVHVIFDLHFDTLTAMHAALASDVRQQVRQSLAAIMGVFQGRTYHLVLEQSEQEG